MKYFLYFLFLTGYGFAQVPEYPWLNETGGSGVRFISAPVGYTRVKAAPGSFAQWIRNVPLKAHGTAVYLYSGDLKANQNVHFRVLDIDTGTRDLQQCADAVIRLWAEYLFSRGLSESIRFHFTSGHEAAYSQWKRGFRPKVNGNRVTWHQNARPDSSYTGFRAYLNTVFSYAGSYSLSRHLKKRQLSDIEIGDVFLEGGFPGHAVIVVDKAVSSGEGKTALMLAQSYMPAQDIHVLRNSADSSGNPWYVIGATDKLYTPEWTFEWGDLYYYEGLR
ncbi:DUF4846 domain-containing protein [candidate division KSB1 bacterium]|nr:DUF4846 domain-containing protein [candidate division KSB1 bacterium]